MSSMHTDSERLLPGSTWQTATSGTDLASVPTTWVTRSGWRAELVPVKRDGNWALAEIAASLTQTLAGQDAQRVRICANVDCRWIFHDPTKGGTKRWCNDRTCGNRARVRRARAAQKRSA